MLNEALRLKKYLVFLVSFFVFYLGMQLISGFILTFLYPPDISVIIESGVDYGQEVEFGQKNPIPYSGILIIATLAYFLSQKLTREAK